MKKIVPLLALAVLLATCASAEPVVTTIYNIRAGLHNQGDTVTVENCVVTGIDLAPTTYGFWMQELAGGPQGGILVYSGNIHPGGLRRGHIVDVTGIYEEYPGPDTCSSCSEITYSPLSWEIVDSMVVPDPVLLSAGDMGLVAADCPTAEPWEGLFTRLDTVVVARHLDYTNFLLVEAHSHLPATPGDSVFCRPDKMRSPGPSRPAVGDTLASLTGVLSFENGNYRFYPRDVDDFVYMGLDPAPNLVLAYATSSTGVRAIFDRGVDSTSAVNTGNYFLGTGTPITLATIESEGAMVVDLTTGEQLPCDAEGLTVCCVKNEDDVPMSEAQTEYFRGGICPITQLQTPVGAGNDSSQYAGEQVTTSGIVTADKSVFTTHFYMEDVAGGPWSGIQVYGGIPTPVTEGDNVVVSGFLSEYFFKTEITGVDYVNVLSSGNPLPGPDVVDPSAIRTGSPTAEEYEGVFVRCERVAVVDTAGFDLFGGWSVADLTPDTVGIAHNASYTYVPTIGEWMHIQGPMDYAYDEFRMEPRYDADIDLTLSTPGGEPRPLVFALEQNFPNPFNPVTTIFFSVPGRDKVELCIYDVSGRLVKTLIDGVPMEPGRHRSVWDGTNDAGRFVSSGVYFTKLSAGDKVADGKMVLLK
ncbi:MAG: T9SS type A sorting domain-containing protein [Candidatus Eiseniibacteriota bacterium]|nr:MAG: T9SS type A sorting domain-containing protein [Candidatus Eisenbacteria bacterium]